MSKNNKHVLACGVFDLFHIGHLRYLQYASSRGDNLTVAISADEISLKIKGKQPWIDQDQRTELVQGLTCVNNAKPYYISLENSVLAVQWIEDWQINHVVAGGDWEGSERWNKLIPLLAQKGISVEFAPRTEDVSTSDIVHAIQNKAAL